MVVTPEQIKRELRHKYLVILKSCYWEFFEEGLCMSSTVNLLIESADQCMDFEDAELSDWKHISGYIMSTSYLTCLSYLEDIPCIGSLAHRYLYDHFSSAYDVLICFIEAHDETKKLIRNVLDESEYINEVLAEAHKQVEQAEKYMHVNIEDQFPEICKAIQHRRAQYYLLVHEYHFVDQMLKHGQIEERDANLFQGKLGAKIHALTLQDPAIELMDMRERLHASTLSYIFTKEEIDKALENADLTEHSYTPGSCIVEQGTECKLIGKVLFVARGNVIEKDGKLITDGVNNKVEPQMRFKIGTFACL